MSLYFYDAARRLTQTQTPIMDGQAQRWNTYYKYDQNGRWQ